jgi:hypothetical protein
LRDFEVDDGGAVQRFAERPDALREPIMSCQAEE